ncbi:MAG TPA: ParB/RepB/Spo0J family partition protein [Planctomycetes bacterium]|nr:ParB/RepB/Spo0J family partition protein [Planctomycetota bacterium]HIJ69856.1 ParB/RepB/Spo0J family partition protein [Planctomycetota bacterium]
MVDKPERQRRHLGMGLDALLGPITKAQEESLQEKHAARPAKYSPDKELQLSTRKLRIEAIKSNPYQPRMRYDDDELRELAESIRVKGIIQPILVRETGDGFEIIAGERRLRAAKIAGLNEVPALVRKADDAEMLELALVENIHRADLNPLERAMAYQNYINTFSLTQTDAAKRLGEDRSVVANYLRLLDLPEEIKKMLSAGQLSMGHARAILSLPTDELRRKLANRALAGRLSVREVERLVRKALQVSGKKVKVVETPPHILDLEKRLQEILGTKVTISKRNRSNRGRIIIDFYSLDEFDRLTEKMGLSRTENV